MQSINTWKLNNKLCDSNDKLIDEINSNIRNGIASTFLLDLTKNKYTFTEKYVYDIAMFHFARLNIHNTENHYVEFWFKHEANNNELHVDCDECLKNQGNYQYPILASVTYLNDFYNSPTILTNIDNDICNNKDFENQLKLYYHYLNVTNISRLMVNSFTVLRIYLTSKKTHQDIYLLLIYGIKNH